MVSQDPHFRNVEASEHLRPLLDRAVAEGELTITRDGVPMARLVPFKGRRSTPEEVQQAIAAIEEFGKHRSLGGLSWKELRDEGRKW